MHPTTRRVHGSSILGKTCRDNVGEEPVSSRGSQQPDLSFAFLGKASRGKAKVKTGIGKSDLPGLQGPGKRDLFRPSVRALALSRPIPGWSERAKADGLGRGAPDRENDWMESLGDG